jgi:hypothetical protein
VRKGERGIEILVPILARLTDDPESTSNESENEIPESFGLEPNEGQRETSSGYQLVGFRVGHTFDVSQPEVAPLPELVPMNFMGDDQGVYAALAAFAQDVPHIAVEQVESEDSCWCSACSYGKSGRVKRIVVAGNRSPLLRAQTLAHEPGHALLHSDRESRAHTTSRGLSANGIGALVPFRPGEG